MRYNPLNRFLFSEVQETGSGTAGAAAIIPFPAATAAPEEPVAAAPPEAAAAPAREPTLLEKVSAAIRDKSTIIAENTQLKQDIATHQGLVTAHAGTIATLTARVQALETENGLLQADFNSIDAALKATEQKITTIDASAARQIAGMGFEAAALPAAEKQGESIEAMETRLGQETDPQKMVALARQIDALKAKKTD
jgi:hypothetical protein